MDSSLSAWRQFLERLPADHPLRRLSVEPPERTVEDEVLRLAAIVESSEDAILSKNLDGRILSWNAAATRVYGYEPEEVIGRNVSLLVPQGRADDTAEILGKVRLGQAVVRYETTRARKDGRVMDVSLTVSPVRGVDGQIVAASTITRDITERKRAERRLQFLAHAGNALASSLDFETTLRTIARLAVPGVADWCTVDLVDDSGELRRLAASQSDPALEAEAQELASYPPPTAPGSTVARAIASREPLLLADVDDEVFRGLARDERHLELLRRFGFRSAMLVPLFARGRLLGVLTFASVAETRRYDENDLTFGEELGRSAALAIDNARLYREAQTANRMKDEFLATLSHELRTPLTPILGWTRILKSGRVDETTVERALDVIERNVETQSRLIDDLLDVSRITSGKLRLHLEPTELTDVVASAVDAIRPTAEARSLVVETDLASPPLVAYADADRIRQIAWNLLTNAVKFTPRGGCVRVKLARVDGLVELEVSDTGEGIPPEFLPYIFNRFHQADSSTTRVHGGLGLGLAIVRHLAELHGGRVEARSAGRGQGATFIVRLPVLPADWVAHETRRGSAGVSSKETGDAERGTLADLRVLVVDDEEDARELLVMLLGMHGSEVRTAASAREALAAVARWRPDAIVADIGMPDADGYEFIEHVRRLPADRGGTTPAVALTAYAREQDRARALRAGYQAHLPKPVEPGQLLATLEELTRTPDGAGRR